MHISSKVRSVSNPLPRSYPQWLIRDLMDSVVVYGFACFASIVSDHMHENIT